MTSSAARPKLAIVAGRGPLPLALADAAMAAGRPIFVVGLEGESEPAIERFPHGWVRIGAMGKFLNMLKEEGCAEIVMIGPVTRPDLTRIKPDLTGVKLLPRFLKMMRQGDDGLLRGVIDFLEKDHGLKVIAPEDVSADLLAPQGPIGRHQPNENNLNDISQAAKVVRAIGALDIGQGAVVCRGVVLAVEAAEGTDAMLDRLLELSATLKGTAEAREGVLVKLPKPGQERRIDLPTIGVQTIEKAAAAGLAGIAVEAGGALIYDVAAVARAADAAGLFVTGLEPAATEAAR